MFHLIALKECYKPQHLVISNCYYSGNSRKQTPSGREIAVCYWIGLLMRMVYSSGH